MIEATAHVLLDHLLDGFGAKVASLLRRFTQRNILIFQEPTVAFGLARLMQEEEEGE